MEIRRLKINPKCTHSTIMMFPRAVSKARVATINNQGMIFQDTSEKPIN